ncbi:MAG: winged helix-turn-helix domain-containing protein [Bacilli bacterium]
MVKKQFNEQFEADLDDVDLSQDNKRVPTSVRRIWEEARAGGYGYIEVPLYDVEGYTEIRKITSDQRKAIIAYYIATHNGKSVSVRFLADKLGTKERTIQYELRWLEKKGYIKREETMLSNGGHGPNKYYRANEYEEGEFYDFHPTFAKIYGPSNTLGLRNWHWKDYKDIPNRENSTHTQQDKYENYLELTKKRRINDKKVLHNSVQARSPLVRKRGRSKKNKK